MRNHMTYFRRPKMKALNLMGPSDRHSSLFNVSTKSFRAFVEGPKYETENDYNLGKLFRFNEFFIVSVVTEMVYAQLTILRFFIFFPTQNKKVIQQWARINPANSRHNPCLSLNSHMLIQIIFIFYGKWKATCKYL